MAYEMSGGTRDASEFVEIAVDSSGDNQTAPIVATKPGKVRFVELDAENLGEWFRAEQAAGNGDLYDAIWISEALSHFLSKGLFFHSASHLLRPDGGKLVVADWFKEENLSFEKARQDIRPIESRFARTQGTQRRRCYEEADCRSGNAPPASLHTERVCGLCRARRLNGLRGADGHQQASIQNLVRQPIRLSSRRPHLVNLEYCRDISIDLVADPSLWALALTQGRDIIHFLKTFQTMRRAYANGSFRYAVMVFKKKRV